MADRFRPPGAPHAETSREGAEARLALSGDIDIAAVALLEDAFARVTGDGPETLVVDLTDVTLLDSTGLSALIQGARRAHERGVRLSTEVPRGHEARVVIDLSGLSDVLGLSAPAGR